MKDRVLTYSDSRLATGALIAFFTLLMVLSAYVRIPLFITPVPLTLQTLVLFISIPVLKKRASLSQMLYVLLGVIGLPVFTNAGAGIVYLLGPTGGYLLGFIFAALLVGSIYKSGKSFLHYVLLFTGATAIIYASGASWLIGIHGLNLQQAFIAGVVPFMPAAVVKISLACLFAVKYK